MALPIAGASTAAAKFAEALATMSKPETAGKMATAFTGLNDAAKTIDESPGFNALFGNLGSLQALAVPLQILFSKIDASTIEGSIDAMTGITTLLSNPTVSASISYLSAIFGGVLSIVGQLATKLNDLITKLDETGAAADKIGSSVTDMKAAFEALPEFYQGLWEAFKNRFSGDLLEPVSLPGGNRF